MVPAAGFVDETVFGGGSELAKRTHERRAGRGRHAHFPRGGDALRRAQHPRAVGLGRHHAHEHLGRLNRQQDFRAGLQNVVLLGENSRVIRSSTRSLAFSAAIAGPLPVSGVVPR